MNKSITEIEADVAEWVKKPYVSVLPEEAERRKAIPVYTGFIQYFPRAIVAVTECSVKGRNQHHPDGPLYWDRNKSADDKDALMRHVLEQNWAAAAWRAMAVLEKELETKENT
jgi:hypothetical protein